MKAWDEFIKGFWSQNPIFRLVLGLCPVLAVTTAAFATNASSCNLHPAPICSGFCIVNNYMLQ